MAVISVNRVGEQRIREVNNIHSGTVDLVFRVRTDSPTDGQAIVLASTQVSSQIAGGVLSVPKPFDAYDKPYVSTAEAAAMQAVLWNPSACKCTRRVARQTDNNQTWEVTCTFTSENPLSVPIKVTTHEESIKLGVDSDLDGLAVRNSYGDPYSNACEVESSQLRIHVVKNYATYDPIGEARFIASPARNPDARAGGGDLGGNPGITNVGGPINEKTWWGFPPKTVRYKPGNTEYMNDLDVPINYWRREFDFIVSITGWNYQPLDAGWRGLTAANQTTTFNEVGQRRSQPTLLDGTGHQLAINARGQYIAAPIYMNYAIYPPKDFAFLGLDNDCPWPV